MDQEVEISVVAPVFNEEACLIQFVEELHQTLESSRRSFEVVCVDDGSDDATRTILVGLQARYPSVRPLALDGHHGQSAAIAAGVVEARGRYIALIDADMQNDPADIPRLVGLLERRRELDAVVGVRARRQDSGVRRLSSRVANRCSWWITGDKVSDAGCGLKLCRAAVLKRVTFFRGAHRFLPTLLRGEGATVLEAVVGHRERRSGSSKYGHGLARTFTALRDAFGVRWMSERRLRFQARGLGGES
jgi:dolichol-phosphate mannosyltransferase